MIVTEDVPKEPSVIITLTRDEACRLALCLYGVGSEDVRFEELFYALPMDVRDCTSNSDNCEIRAAF